MNRFEYLYHKKQLLEKKIAKNDLFKLGTKDAIQCVMIKVGMLYSFFTVGDYNKKQQYMKKLIKTNATDIDEITFFQESLKWICSTSLFDKWVKQASNSGSFHEKDNRTPEQEELIWLRKENQQLRMENDILKQAALILGRK